jgi:hypothetical protein
MGPGASAVSSFGPRLKQRRGLSVIYVVVFLVALIAFVSLAVDVGRIRLARTEVQLATDAAARAGVVSIPIGTQAVYENAVAAADQNGVIDEDTSQATPDGARINPGLELVPTDDVFIGKWDPKANPDEPFTEITDPKKLRSANAVKIWGRRISERNNPIPLIFGPVIGVFSNDIERPAIAKLSGGGAHIGFIGITNVRFNGDNATVDGGGVGSDGNIDLGNGNVIGDARPGENGGQINFGPNGQVTGWTAPLDYVLAPLYRPAVIPPGATPLPAPVAKVYTLVGSNNAGNPKNFTGTIDQNTKTINVTGYCRVYVDADLDLRGCSVTNAGGQSNQLEFYVVGAHKVDLGGNSTQTCHVYAPQSDVKVHGTPGFTGWIVGLSLTIDGTANLHYDGKNNPGQEYHVTLVK